MHASGVGKNTRIKLPGVLSLKDFGETFEDSSWQLHQCTVYSLHFICCYLDPASFAALITFRAYWLR